MARTEWAVDTSDAVAAMKECIVLAGDGAGLPARLKDRLARCFDGCNDGVLDIEFDGDTVYARPGPEMICVAAELRAARAVS